MQSLGRRFGVVRGEGELYLRRIGADSCRFSGMPIRFPVCVPAVTGFYMTLNPPESGNNRTRGKRLTALDLWPDLS